MRMTAEIMLQRITSLTRTRDSGKTLIVTSDLIDSLLIFTVNEYGADSRFCMMVAKKDWEVILETKDVMCFLDELLHPCYIPIRALIEVSSENALMDSLVVAIPFQNGSGHTMETIDIEYEWQPPRFDMCKIFDHNDDQYLKKVKADVPDQVSDDGFVEVTCKHGNGKNSKSKHIDGVRLTKPKLNYYYRPVSKPVNVNGEASTSQPNVNKEPTCSEA
ncbi:hypothetical protein Tco_0247992 [Tanacetum coccineum]